MNVEFKTCPVGGHNMHGKVERRIQEIRKSIENTVHNERLSVIQWETLFAQIANSINDQPLALGNIVADFENMDLLTPNRLRLGRNNNRSPTGSVEVTNNPTRIIKDNQRIFNTWFECWIISHVPKLMHQPKWFVSDRDVKEGDIVLFQKQDNILCKIYQYGMVKDVRRGVDYKIRQVIIKYRNANEKGDRETTRAVRQLTMIHPVDETSLFDDLQHLRHKMSSN